MEITLEAVELVKDRTGVTYKEAKEALEANDGNVVDAIIAIENDIEAGNKSWVKEDAGLIVEKIKNAVKKGNISKIVITKGDDVLLNLPLNVGILGAVIAPWATVAGVIAAFGTKCQIALVTNDGRVVDVNGAAVSGVEAAKAKSAEIVGKVKENEFGEKAQEFGEKAVEFGGKAVDKAKDVAEDLLDKGGDFLSDLKNKIDK